MNKKDQDKLKYLDNKFNEIKRNEEKDLVIDFDKAVEEHYNKSQKLKVKFMGKYYEVPSEMSFNFAMFFFRNCMRTDDQTGKTIFDIPDSKIQEFIERMFGSDFLEALESCNNHKVTMSFVFKNLSMEILEKWGYKINPENENKNLTQKKIQYTK